MWKSCQNNLIDNMTQQRWKASWVIYVNITSYIHLTNRIDRTESQHIQLFLSISLGRISSVSPWARTWMVFITNTLWIIVICLLLCWFCTSSGRRVWFHFTNIWCKTAQVIWQLSATSLYLVSTGYSDSPCMHIAFVLCIFGCAKSFCLEILIVYNFNGWYTYS